MSRPLTLMIALVFAFAAQTASASQATETSQTNQSETLSETTSPELVASLSVHGVVDYGCLARHQFSTKVLQSNRLVTMALKNKKRLSKNILCNIRNENKAYTLG